MIHMDEATHVNEMLAVPSWLFVFFAEIVHLCDWHTNSLAVGRSAVISGYGVHTET